MRIVFNRIASLDMIVQINAPCSAPPPLMANQKRLAILAALPAD